MKHYSFIHNFNGIKNFSSVESYMHKEVVPYQLSALSRPCRYAQQIFSYYYNEKSFINGSNNYIFSLAICIMKNNIRYNDEGNFKKNIY